MLNATRIKTLMWREWLQNRWTWLIAIAALPVLTLVALPFGKVETDAEAVPAALVGTLPLLLTPLTCVLVAWGTTLFMATGVARRDWQDRSIEFWLSLPSTHAESIGAQYLMHGLVFPLLALLLGLGLGALLVPVALFKFTGGLGGVPWAGVLGVLAVPVVLTLPALVLGALWMAPVVLTLMAASVWLKRLALPLLAVLAVFLSNFPGTRDAVRALATDYAHRVGFLVEGLVGVVGQRLGEGVPAELGARATSASGYLGEALADLASLPFALAVAVSLAAGWAIALKRRRG